MDISDIEKKLIDVNKNLNSIIEMVRELKKPEENVVEEVAGAWGYDVDSVEFTRELRQTRRIKLWFLLISILVDILRSKQIESSKLLFKNLQAGDKGFVSVITVAELSAGAYRSPRKDALEKTFKLLSLVHIINLTTDIAVEGGKIYARLVERGEEIEMNDCLIAATSLSLSIHKIVTRDIDHFCRIANIEAVTPEDLGF